jgi:hypothetical protein
MNYIEWVSLPNLKRITLSLLLETYLLLNGVPDDTGHLISVQLYPNLSTPSRNDITGDLAVVLLLRPNGI